MKTSFSAVKRIEQRFVIKLTLNRKVRSGRPTASTIKDDHRFKMTVLKVNFFWPPKHFFHIFLIKILFPLLFLFCQSRKRILSCCFEFLLCSTKVYLYPSISHFKPVVVFYCGSSGVTRTNFPVQCAFNNNPLPNSLKCWKRCFQHFFFQICKNPLVSHIFRCFSCNSIF